jgi:hypothetical protein
MRLLRQTNKSRLNMFAVRRKGTTFSTGNNGRRSLWYPVIGSIAITTAGGVKYAHDHVGGTEGLTRSLSFYRYVGWGDSFMIHSNMKCRDMSGFVIDC